MYNESEVVNVPDDYNVENSVTNLGNNMEMVNRELESDQKEVVNADLKLPVYKKILHTMSKVPKRTIPVLTKYERARIIGVRMQQLASGAKPCIDTRGMKSVEEVAYAELRERVLPYIVKRPLPNGTSEFWKLEEFLSVL